MIKLLKKRGNIKAKMEDDKIIINEIKVLIEEINRPKSAFITFFHSKALNLINSLNR
jgi:hypothetical protein